MALTNYNEDSYEPEDFPEYTPPDPPRKSGGSPFLTVISILALVFLAAMIALYTYGSRMATGKLAGPQQTALVISAGKTATALATVQFTQAAPTESVLLPATVAPEGLAKTNSPAVILKTSTATAEVGTNTPLPENTSTPTISETEIVALLQTALATQLPTESVTTPQSMVATPLPTGTMPALEETPAATEGTKQTETIESTPMPTETPGITATVDYTSTSAASPESTAMLVSSPTSTPSPEPTATLEPSPTSTSTPEPTATLEATLTATAVVLADAAAATPTTVVSQLPDTGFADNIGLPFLALSALLLLTTIILSRKKRLS